MNIDDGAALDEIVAQFAEREATEHVLRDLQAHVDATSCYIFWFDKGSGASGGARRSRTLLAFATPDAAFAFAQRNDLLGPDTRPRLRRLGLARLLLAVLREPSIVALRLVRDDTSSLPGHLPDGLHLSRAELLARLHTQ